MNYLAHIYLSGNSPQTQIGGFIADAVKGRYDYFPQAISAGIRLHRQIDAFTDSHETVKECVARLRPRFGRYSVVLPDLFFDHFLAARFRELTGQSLTTFSYRFYLALIVNYRFLPVRIRRFMWHFILTNRLERYRTPEGLADSLRIMNRYHRLPLQTSDILLQLKQEYDFYKSRFDLFFPELIRFADRTRECEKDQVS